MGSITTLRVVGSANMDVVFQVPRLPVPGETLIADTYRFSPGGKGANQAVASAKLGAPTDLYCRIGSDPFGDQLESALRDAGVNLAPVPRSDRFGTGIASIYVDRQGRNEIVVASGSNADLSIEHLGEDDGQVDVALAQLEIPLVAALEAMRRARRGILNPAPAVPLSQLDLKGLFLITPNETEAQSLTGTLPTDDASCAQVALVLMEAGVENVIITLGENGCFVATATRGVRIPAPTVRANDTTAAGDAFNGALAAFLLEGRDLENAAALANHAGALCATRIGAMSAMPTLAELRAFAETLY